MIASTDPRRPLLSRPTLRPVAVALAFLLAGCVGERQTTLLRSSRAREVGKLRAERERQERELAIWQATRDLSVEEAATARLESVRASSRLRSARAELMRELDKLQRNERELVAAQQRAQEIEQELAPLRALEQTLRDRERLIADAEARIKALAGEVAKATEGVAEQESQLKPRLAALLQRLRDLKAVGAALDEAEAKVAAAAKVLAPPPAKEPAKEPAKAPAKKE